MELISIGTLREITESITVTDTLTKRTFVVLDKTTSKTPQLYQFTLFNDNCRLIDGYEIGTEIKVTATLKSRENNDEKYKSKYFLSLTATGIEGIVTSVFDFNPSGI